MSLPRFLSGHPSMTGMDILLAKLGVVASLFLLGLRLFASQVFLLVIPLAIGTGSAVYLIVERRQRAGTVRPTLPGRVAGYLPGVVILGLAALVVSIHRVGVRTDPIYLLIGAIGVAIFGQILLLDDDTVATGPVLVQVLAAAVTIRLTALYATPGYVGIDIWTHATVFIDGIARTGSLSPLAASKYIMAPFYHVIGAVGALVFGSVRNGVYLTIGLLVPLSALFVYATGKMLLPARWALLATALYAFSDQFIRWGMHLIPTGLGLAFFLAAVYLLTRVFDADAERWAVGLLLACSLAVVFTHQVSTAIALFFLGTATVVAVTLKLVEGDPGDPHGTRKAVAVAGVFAATLVTTLVSWANTPFSAGSTFLWRELAVVATSLAEDTGFLNLASTGGSETVGTAGTQSVLGQLVPYIELFGFGLLLAAAIVGGLLLLRWKVAPDIALTYLLTGGGMFVIVFGLSLFGVRVLLPGRWMVFLYFPLVVLGAVGLYYVSQSGSRRLILAAFVLLAVGYPTTMVVAEKATLDNPAFEDQFARFSFTESEIAAVDSMTDVAPPSSGVTIGTDHPYKSLFERYGGYEAATLTLGADGPTTVETAVAREYQADGPVTFYRADGYEGDTRSAAESVCPHDWNTVYANDDVRVCSAGTAPTEESG
jgi:hypothetical protein